MALPQHRSPDPTITGGGRPRPRRWALGAASLAALGGFTVAAAATASAQPAPLTDLDAFPTPLPAGCPGGPATLNELRWSTGAGPGTTDLTTLDARPGDTVTARWTSFAPGCLAADGTPAVTVSIAAYDGGASPFDPAVDQRLLDGWSSCGVDAGPCLPAGGPYELELVLPAADVTCAVQLDLVIGRPLAVVGPSGSFYSDISRRDEGPNLLIDAGPLDTQPCFVPTTTAPEGGALPSEATVPVSTPSTASPAVTAATTAAGAVLAGSVTAAPAALPFTGRDQRPLLAAALASALAGGVFLAAGRRRRAAR